VRFQSLFAFAILAALVLSPRSPAADPPSGEQPKPGAQKPRPGRLQLAFGPDGRISREKFFADNSTDDPRVKAALEEFFRRLDADGDGFATAAEMQALIARPPGPPGRAPKPSAPTAADDEPADEPAMPAAPAEASAADALCEYAVVLSDVSAGKPEWKAVADALVKKHGGRLVVYRGSVVNCLPELARLHPRYTAFVARPEIVGRQFVARIHRLTRRLDDDPYTDTVWGIVSGAGPEAALRVATAVEPRVVRSVISNTGVSNGLYDAVFTLSDGKPGDWFEKRADGKQQGGSDGDADRTQLFVTKFQELRPDAIVTSGHATEENLEMPFSKGNTESRGGKWYGVVNWRRPGAKTSEILIPPDDHPRVFLGAGNCLIGNFRKSPTSMAAMLISHYGVNQFVGYTVPTWYGKGGWGTLGMWQHLGGRHSLAEAWFFNNQVITHELKSRFPKSADRCLPVSEAGHGLDERRIFSSGVTDKDEAGMLWDRDVVAFYGDPAVRVTTDPGKCETGVTILFSQQKDRCSLEVRIAKKTAGVAGDQPVAVLFPKRIRGRIVLTEGQEYSPVVTDDFLLLRKPKYDPESRYKVQFRVER
jgi:zinc protease